MLGNKIVSYPSPKLAHIGEVMRDVVVLAPEKSA
jgi:hypothetical protein